MNMLCLLAISYGIYLIKDNNKDTKPTSVNVALVSLLLTLNRQLSTGLIQSSIYKQRKDIKERKEGKL